MKGSTCVAVLAITLLCIPALVSARHIGSRQRTHHGHHHHSMQAGTRDGRVLVNPNAYRARRGGINNKRNSRGDSPVEIAGSSLPDCSHACGSCSPCKLVMVSFVCASLEEAETCPMAYKCMCRNKSYPVP